MSDHLHKNNFNEVTENRVYWRTIVPALRRTSHRVGVKIDDSYIHISDCPSSEMAELLCDSLYFHDFSDFNEKQTEGATP